MKLEINLNIEDAINKALSPEKLNPLLEKAVNEALKSAIDNATGYRSEFREALEKQMKDALPHGFALDDVAKFQHVLNASMSKLVDVANNETVKAAMDKVVKSVMPDVPARVKVSELIKDARQGFLKADHEAFYAKYRESEYSSGSGWLSLDEDEGCRSERSAGIQLAISKNGEVYSLKMDGKQIMPSSVPNALGHFEGLLLSMYVGRTTIEMDIDADDIESLARDQSDC